VLLEVVGKRNMREEGEEGYKQEEEMGIGGWQRDNADANPGSSC